jgi:hypothetical protein
MAIIAWEARDPASTSVLRARVSARILRAPE